jgi:hypothetical protein
VRFGPSVIVLARGGAVLLACCYRGLLGAVLRRRKGVGTLGARSGVVLGEGLVGPAAGLGNAFVGPAVGGGC